jgi:hypothetical protein
MTMEETVAVASPDGIKLFDADNASAVLTSDPYYEAISWVVADGAGGFVYTHEVTPLPWPQGTLLRLEANASNPVPVVAPQDGGLITPLGVEDETVFYRLDNRGESQVRAAGFDGSNDRVVVGPTPMMASAALGDGMVVVGLGGECGGYRFYDTGGNELATPEWAMECSPGVHNDIAVADGFVFTLSDIDSQRQLVRIDLSTGERASTPIDEGWQVEAESAMRVAVGGPVITVGDFSGDEFVPTESHLGGNGTFALLPEGQIRVNARLGSGLGELPCTPLDVPNPSPSGLPDAIEETFQEVFTLAKTCDLHALAELVRNDRTSFTFGDNEDPVKTWVRSARSGFDVMPMTVRLLNDTPAVTDDGTYVWPAVAETNSEEDWQRLSGILSAAEFEEMYQWRESGYLGLRIGIAENGRLVFLIAGD